MLKMICLRVARVIAGVLAIFCAWFIVMAYIEIVTPWNSPDATLLYLQLFTGVITVFLLKWCWQIALWLKAEWVGG